MLVDLEGQGKAALEVEWPGDMALRLAGSYNRIYGVLLPRLRQVSSRLGA
jgi:hypothetical protein